MTTVALHTRFEAAFESAQDYENAVQDVRVEVELACGEFRSRADAYWDGGRTWRFRFTPAETGEWRWRTLCSRKDDSGLHERRGVFECLPAAGPNPLYQHGALRVSPDRRHLVYADGTPFFWLGDTAWNGPLKSRDADWDSYLSDRARKGFNVIQFVATQWISAAGDAEGRPAYLGKDRIRTEPAFFRRLDRRIDAINAAGMVAAPVLAWAAAWNRDSVHLNPGNTLSDEQLVQLVRYVTSRYGAHHAVWILAGDGIYEGEEAQRWRRIGRAALSQSNHLATMHPGGKLWTVPEFRNEPWFSFNGYQSGHWNDDDNFRWINAGPPASDWRTEPRCPHINLEPCYEGHRSMAAGGVIDAYAVRRACYWSLLAAPPAGVSYGAHGIWSWESRPELPMSHPNTGVAPAWFDALEFPGSDSMAHLQALFSSIEWWRLDPASELLETQPGRRNPAKHIAAACSSDGGLALIYLPEGGEVRLRTGLLCPNVMAACFNPAEGALLWQRPLAEFGSFIDTGGPGDRVLLLRSNKS